MSTQVHTRRSSLWVIVAVTVIVVALLPGVVVGTGTAPAPPAAYYGEATINGEPLPAGTTIVAKIDGEVRGSITLAEVGQYGGPGAFENKLTVNGSSNETGKTVTFHVGGLTATETVQWSSGNVTQLNLTFTDEQSPTAEAGTDRRVEVGEEVTFDGSNSTDNGALLEYKWGLDDGSSAVGKRVTHTFSEPGTYTVTLAVADVAGMTDADSVTVSVVDPDDTPTDSGSSGGSGGSGSGDESDSDEGATIEKTTLQEAVTVQFKEVPVGASLAVELDETTLSNERVGLTSLELDFTFDEDGFRLEINRPRAPPTESRLADNVKALSYVEVQHVGLDESNVESARFYFTVNESALPPNTGYEDIAMYRNDNGTWKRLETTHLGDGTFRASSPGFSQFAIGVTEPTKTGTSTPTDRTNGTEVSATSETPTEKSESSGTERTGTTTDREGPGFSLLTTALTLILSQLAFRRYG